MATNQSGATIVASHEDAIRVVPVHGYTDFAGLANDAPAAPGPQLTYRGGPLIEAAEVFTIFWGSGWDEAPAGDLIDRLRSFFSAILTSELIDQLAEYNVEGRQIGHGSYVGSTIVTSPSLGVAVSDSAIQHMLQGQLATNSALPKPGGNMLYFVYLPPGVSVSQGGDRSCQAFCGYHNDISGQIFYAVMPYPGCAGCTGGLSALDALTSTSSHELCEAITDAIPGQGWYDDVHGEIGDICAWTTKEVAGYTVQLEWSNKQSQCV
jgi:hypothetical protein